MFSSLFSVHGHSSNPVHLISFRSSFSSVSSKGFSGMVGVTVRRDTCARIYGGAIELAGLLNSESFTRKLQLLGNYDRSESTVLIRYCVGRSSNNCGGKNDPPSPFILWNWFAFGPVRRSGSGTPCSARSRVTAQWLESGP